MRITGLGLLAYFIGHIYETSHILDGKAVWDASLEMTQTTEGHIFLAIVIGMCVYPVSYTHLTLPTSDLV